MLLSFFPAGINLDPQLFGGISILDGNQPIIQNSDRMFVRFKHLGTLSARLGQGAVTIFTTCYQVSVMVILPFIMPLTQWAAFRKPPGCQGGVAATGANKVTTAALRIQLKPGAPGEKGRPDIDGCPGQKGAPPGSAYFPVLPLAVANTQNH